MKCVKQGQEALRSLIRDAEESGVLEACDHGKVLICEACLDAQYRSGINGGMEVAMRTVHEYLGKAASDLFLKGNDDEAKALRKILVELDKTLKAAQSAQLRKVK